MDSSILYLNIYSAVMTIAFVALLVYLHFRLKNMKEITLERVNIVESNGDLKMVISNSKRQHSGIINGKALPERERQAGMIFFNGSGDECGGLVYDGDERQAGLVFSVDKFKEDQVLQLQYIEDTQTKNRKYGLQFWDYPVEDRFEARMEAAENLNKQQEKGERMKAYARMKEDGLLAEDRLFIGKNMSDDFGLFINDEKGNPKIRIFVDKENIARIRTYDENNNEKDML